jgi:tRNA-specific 2-thiouridylase
MPPGEALANQLARPTRRGHTPTDAFTGAAGGGACSDTVRVSLALDAASPQGLIADAGFDARGCGTAVAAVSAVVELVTGVPLLAAARLGADEISRELGGLAPSKRHAAELAADALHRALGAAARGCASLAPAPKRVLVAMSGGVDSTVAAVLLAERGEEVVGVTLELWGDAENDGERSCCSAQAVRGARALAHSLGMAHLSIDLRSEFRAAVVEPWLRAHISGLTPYPCLRCNGSVRIAEMLALCERLGAATLATGHYARVRRDPDGREALLAVAADSGKDQSYALAALAPQTLARLRFPLGALTKARVREIAAEAGLEVARKPDSQDLCFLAGTDRTSFLARHGDLQPSPGPIVELGGQTLGEHRGQHRFTVGQRHGLGIGGGPPRFVLATDARTNTVVVGARELLLTRALELEDVTLYVDAALVDAVKVRSRGARASCTVAASDGAAEGPKRRRGGRLRVELREPIERTAPGQVACLYCDDLLVGYGTLVASGLPSVDMPAPEAPAPASPRAAGT